jgi:hypothetical protein
MKIEVSNGEIVDKITILMIKQKFSDNEQKTININNELNYLKSIYNCIECPQELMNELLEINKSLWDIEDEIRILESEKNFGEKFINLARKVYHTNDKRFEIKTKINLLTSSEFIEEKILPKYENSVNR